MQRPRTAGPGGPRGQSDAGRGQHRQHRSGERHAGATRWAASGSGAYHPSGDTLTAGSVLPPPRAEEALGSGFIFDPAGYVLTNNHVIDGAASITVTLQDGTILPATLVGRDAAADLAVLKIDAGHKLPFVTFGNSGKLRVGDWVLAIGNPFGLPGSTSAGIVSALNRDINEGAYDDFIQTDAAINRGNSGGPLFNLQGQVIGVNSAIYSPSGGSIGIGFAIPSAMAMPVAYELKNTGSMTRGWLGVDTQQVTPPDPAPARPARHRGRAGGRRRRQRAGRRQTAAGRRAGLAGRRTGGQPARAAHPHRGNPRRAERRGAVLARRCTSGRRRSP